MHTAGECLFYGNVSGQKAIELCHFLLLKKKVMKPPINQQIIQGSTLCLVFFIAILIGGHKSH